MNDKNKKSKVTVEIFGESYALKGDDEIESIKAVAALVDQKMRKISRYNARLATEKIAVLAALHIAEEYLRLEKDYLDLVDTLKEEQ